MSQLLRMFSGGLWAQERIAAPVSSRHPVKINFFDNPGIAGSTA